MSTIIKITEKHVSADIEKWGYYTGTREAVDAWLAHPVSRRARFIDVHDGERDLAELVAWYDAQYELVQAVHVADYSPLDDDWDWFSRENVK